MKPEEDKNEIEYTLQEMKALRKQIKGSIVDKDGNELLEKKTTRTCCSCVGVGGLSAPKKISKKVDAQQRSGSIKHSSTVISQKKQPSQQPTSQKEDSKADSPTVTVSPKSNQ